MGAAREARESPARVWRYGSPPSHLRARRIPRLSVALVVAVGSALPLGGRLAQASHSDPKPNTTASWYMDIVTQSVYYDKGCAFANRIENGGEPKVAVVMMAFGSPRKIDANTWGASMFGGVTQSTLKIRQALQEWGRGLYNCLAVSLRDEVRVQLGAGVTNDYPSAWVNADANDHGWQWAQMVQNGNNWFVNNGYSAVVSMIGGADIEMNWAGPGITRAWVNGYNSNTPQRSYYNFGDAAGCQTFTTGNASSCNGNWDSADVYYVSWEVATAWPLPEIYNENGTNAEQWVMISQWAINNGKPRMGFRGPLSQHGACGQVGGCGGVNNTSTAAWNQMVNKMDLKPATIVDMLYSTDIKWQNP